MADADLVKQCAWYLFESGGDVEYFHRHRKGAQRLGQAFANALTDADRAKLQDSVWDTFYDDSNIPYALDLLNR